MIFAVLAVVFFALNVADMILTDRILDRGGRESNPVLAAIMGQGESWRLVKMGVATLAVVILYAFAPEPWDVWMLGVLIAAWVYVVWHNARVLRRMARR